MRVLPVIPSLVTDVENLWREMPQTGKQKCAAVEQALGGSVSEVVNKLMAAAPQGTKAEDITAAVAVFARQVNDATVQLANALQVFPHAAPTVAAAESPKV